jgi:hypothetical protein
VTATNTVALLPVRGALSNSRLLSAQTWNWTRPCAPTSSSRPIAAKNCEQLDGIA